VNRGLELRAVCCKPREPHAGLIAVRAIHAADDIERSVGPDADMRILQRARWIRTIDVGSGKPPEEADPPEIGHLARDFRTELIALDVGDSPAVGVLAEALADHQLRLAGRPARSGPALENGIDGVRAAEQDGSRCGAPRHEWQDPGHEMPGPRRAQNGSPLQTTFLLDMLTSL
jgi:hypothetical protein